MMRQEPKKHEHLSDALRAESYGTCTGSELYIRVGCSGTGGVAWRLLQLT